MRKSGSLLGFFGAIKLTQIAQAELRYPALIIESITFMILDRLWPRASRSSALSSSQSHMEPRIMAEVMSLHFKEEECEYGAWNFTLAARSSDSDHHPSRISASLDHDHFG
jgi:hypothetical protein